MGQMQLNVPAIGILRGVDSVFFSEILSASYEKGLEAIEVTINTDKALDMVSSLRSKVRPGQFLGMGTIRNLEEAKLAINAGAMFLVTPNLDTAVINHARENGVPVIAGAFTPTEVYQAWNAGADMVKVFPCNAVGPGYIKSLLGPFDEIPLVAVGGVSRSNLSEFFDAGVKAVGVSSALFGQNALVKKDINALAQSVENFIEHCRQCSSKT